MKFPNNQETEGADCGCLTPAGMVVVMRQKQFLELDENAVDQLAIIGDGCPNKGFHKIYEILLTENQGVSTPIHVDAEQKERFEEAVRTVA